MKLASWNIYIPRDKSKEVEFDIVYGEPESSWCGITAIEDGDLYVGKISFESFMKNDYPKNKQFQFLIDNSTKTHVVNMCSTHIGLKDRRPWPLHSFMSKVQTTYHFCDENQTAYTHYAFGDLGLKWNEATIKFMSSKIQYIKKKIMEAN